MKNPASSSSSASSFASDAVPRDFAASTLLSLVVFAAITPLLLLVAPAVAAQLGVQLGLSASQIGTYFFVELGAFSCATLPSLFWLGRVDARRVAAVAIAVFCAGNFATALLMPGYAGLLALRTITALGGGTLMVLCMTSAATSANRDRVYGLWVVGQLVAGALGLFLLSYVGLGISMWPLIVPPSITIWEAAAPPSTQAFLLIGAVILIPIILIYTGYVYWLFRGKITAESGYH